MFFFKFENVVPKYIFPKFLPPNICDPNFCTPNIYDKSTPVGTNPSQGRKFFKSSAPLASQLSHNEYTDRIAKVQTLGVCAPPLTTPPLTIYLRSRKTIPPKEIQQRVSWNIRNFFTELKYYHKFNNKILNYSILQNLRQKFTCKENVPISYTLRYMRSTHNVTSNRSP